MSKKAKIRLADAIIVFCVCMATIITAIVLYEYHRLDTVLPANVLTIIYGFFLGELMTVALRQIFGSDVVRQAKRKDDISV